MVAMSDFPSKADAAIERLARERRFETDVYPLSSGNASVTFRQPDPVAPAVTLQSAAEDLANACAEVERVTASMAKARASLASLGEEMDAARATYETALRRFNAALAESAKARAKVSP